MSEEARVELTGDTTKLDRKVEESARKQTQLAQITAQEMETINSAINNKALRDFDRVGAAASRSTEAVGRPMVKLKEEMRLFGGVSMRVGAGITTTLVAATIAAKALINELEKAQKIKAGLGKDVGDQTLQAATALSRGGITDVDKVISAAKSAGGPVKQEQINSFLVKLGESGLKMDGDRAAGLVRTYAEHATVLGDGSSILAAQKLYPDRNPQSLADAAISYRARTGKELSLDTINEKDKAITDAEEKLNEAASGLEESKRGGSYSAFKSAQQKSLDARQNLVKAQAERSELFTLASPVAGVADEAFAELGPQALRAAAIRQRERSEEIKDNESGSDDLALAEQMRVIQQRARDRRANETILGGGISGVKASIIRATGIDNTLSSLESIGSEDSARDRASRAAAGQINNQVVDAIREQTRVLTPPPPRRELRQNAQDEF
jgi:hypothetical protein